MKALLLFLAALTLSVASVPTPTLYEYHYKEDRIFGLYWLSAGVGYKYFLEANTGNGWFLVAIWEDIPKGISMTGYTYYGTTQPVGIARVRVEQREDPPLIPKGIIRWKALAPVKF